MVLFGQTTTVMLLLLLLLLLLAGEVEVECAWLRTASLGLFLEDDMLLLLLLVVVLYHESCSMCDVVSNAIGGRRRLKAECGVRWRCVFGSRNF